MPVIDKPTAATLNTDRKCLLTVMAFQQLKQTEDGRKTSKHGTFQFFLFIYVVFILHPLLVLDKG